MSERADADRPWLVACLCAAWCRTCDDYRPTFDALAKNLELRRPTLMSKTVFGLGIGWSYLRYPCGYRVGDTVAPGTPLCAEARTLLRGQMAAIRAGVHSRAFGGIAFYTFYQADAGTIPVVEAAANEYFP